MNIQVKYLDLPKQFKDERFWVRLKEQFETCQFIMGPELQKFESRFAELCQTPFALGVNSGTDALFLSLKGLGIGPGDDVITAPNSFVATAGAIIATGATPIFVDVGTDYNMDVGLIEQAITPCTKVVLPVHLTGNPADMIRIMEISRNYGLYVIEDAAQAVMSSMNGQRVGSFGDTGCFSLHPLKNLNVCGDGGVITTRSKKICEKIKLMRNHGLINRDEIEFFAYNSRLDEIQASIANYVLDQLTMVTQQRVKNAKLYDNGLKELYDFVTLPPRKENVEQVFHTYVIQVKDRPGLMKYLYEHGVETKIHYPIPIHLQNPCQKYGYKKGDFPVCERQAEQILSLPIHQHLREDQIYYVVELIKGFYKVT